MAAEGGKNACIIVKRWPPLSAPIAVAPLLGCGTTAATAVAEEAAATGFAPATQRLGTLRSLDPNT
jgi:hypothetical protein